MTSETLAFISLAISTTVAFVGGLVRTLYQKDSEAQKEAINGLKAEIEALKKHDSVGALVRTLYQKDSEAQREAITMLRAEIESLKKHDSALSDRVHAQDNQLTKIFVTLNNIEQKLDSIIKKREDLL